MDERTYKVSIDTRAILDGLITTSVIGVSGEVEYTMVLHGPLEMRYFVRSLAHVECVILRHFRRTMFTDQLYNALCTLDITIKIEYDTAE